MFKIEELADEENKKVQKAHIDYGVVFDNANKLVAFTWNFIPTIYPEAWIFISFLSQVQKSLYLSLMSVIRGHSVQTQMMLRYSLESAVLACYGLHNQKIDDFGKLNEDGTFMPNKKVAGRAYKWIDSNYNYHSKKIKYFKDHINGFSTHANLFLTVYNYKLEDSGRMTNSFFDERDALITKSHLWWIGNIAFGLLDLFSKVINDYPVARLVDDFTVQMKTLGMENEQIKNHLKANTQFARFFRE